MNNMILALEITALGMGLVFAAIVLLWGMIHALTSITAEKDKSDQGGAPMDVSPLPPPMDTESKARAAAVAVAIALSEQQTSGAHLLPMPPTALVSAWQMGMRTRQMYQKGIPTRKQPRETGR